MANQLWSLHTACFIFPVTSIFPLKHGVQQCQKSRRKFIPEQRAQVSKIDEIQPRPQSIFSL